MTLQEGIKRACEACRVAFCVSRSLPQRDRGPGGAVCVAVPVVVVVIFLPLLTLRCAVTLRVTPLHGLAVSREYPSGRPVAPGHTLEATTYEAELSCILSVF